VRTAQLLEGREPDRLILLADPRGPAAQLLAILGGFGDLPDQDHVFFLHVEHHDMVAFALARGKREIDLTWSAILAFLKTSLNCRLSGCQRYFCFRGIESGHDRSLLSLVGSNISPAVKPGQLCGQPRVADSSLPFRLYDIS